MPQQSYRDPFIDYLTRRPTSPQGLKASWSPSYLLCEAGYEDWMGKPQGPKRFVERGYKYWNAYLEKDPVLLGWVKSPDAFAAPARWPVELPFPDYVTPAVFGDNVIPQFLAAGIGYDSNASTYLGRNQDKWFTLAAWAHGWHVPQREWKDMQEGASWLLKQIPFVVWVFNLDTTWVPMPLHKSEWKKRLRARHLLTNDPLRVGQIQANMALPKNLHDPKTLVKALRCREPNKVGPSTRQTMVVIDRGETT